MPIDAAEASNQVTSWRDFAECTEPGAWKLFCSAKPEAVAAAKAICETCVVRQECLDFAISHYSDEEVKVWNVWGGTDEMERRSMIRHIRIANRSQVNF